MNCAIIWVISLCCWQISGLSQWKKYPTNQCLKTFQFNKHKGEPILEYFERFPTELKCYACVPAEKVRMKDLAAACLSRVVIAILRNLFALFLSCNKKYPKKFYILLKTITSRYQICFFEEIGDIPDIEMKPPKRVPNWNFTGIKTLAIFTKFSKIHSCTRNAILRLQILVDKISLWLWTHFSQICCCECVKLDFISLKMRVV